MKVSSPALRSGASFLAALCLAALFTLAFRGEAPAAPDAIPAIQTEGSKAEINKIEWASYLRQNAFLRDADAKLNATYRKITSALSPADKKSLVVEQRAWIRQRNGEAFERHPKGSAEYCRFLAGETLKREAALAERYLTAEPATAEPSAPAGRAAPTGASPPASPAPATPVPSPQPAQKTAPAEKAPVAKSPHVKPAIRTRVIDTTPALFGRGYNTLAQSFQTPAFPLTPTNVSGSRPVRTEQYRISDGVSLQFKYTGGNFENPEIITFMARQFMNGSVRDKEETAYALVSVLKTLNKDTPRNPEAKDAEIFGFLRGINNAFTGDASRVWKNGGLVYVITYMHKNDLFAMVITRDSGRQ